jgi:hypothetical protein
MREIALYSQMTNGPARPARGLHWMIDIAILFLGAARTPLLDAYLTRGRVEAAQAAAILQARAVIPVHAEGWAHFTNTPQSVTDAFRAADRSDQLVLLEPRQSASL